MGTMTLTQLENEIRYNLGGRTDLDSRLVTFINWSQAAIAGQGRFRELSVYTYGTYTVADQDYITVPSGTRNLLAAVLHDGTNSRKLKYLPLRKFYKLIPKPDEYTTDRPTHYTTLGSTLKLYRVPDDAYEIYFYREKWPTALASASDTTDFLDSTIDEALVSLGTARAFRSLKMPQESEYWRQIGEDIVRKVLKTQNHTDEELLPAAEVAIDGTVYYEDPFVKAMP
jgi:hypothetical protein